MLPDKDAADRAMAELEGVDFLVVDVWRKDATTVLAVGRHRPGASWVGVARPGNERRCGTTALTTFMVAGMMVMRFMYMPIDKGVEVLHVSVRKGPSLQCRRRSLRASRIGSGTSTRKLLRSTFSTNSNSNR